MSLNRGQRIYGYEFTEVLAIASGPSAHPFAWIISPHVKHDSQTIIQHGYWQEHGKSTHISKQTNFDFLRTLRTHVHNEDHAVMLYRPFGAQHLHSPGLHAQLCMDGPASVVLSWESNADTYEAPQVQEFEPQPWCWLTGFWMTCKDRARGECVSKHQIKRRRSTRRTQRTGDIVVSI